MSRFLVTRRIGIDAGHRIMNHGSKCRHIHGHRYEVEATCAAARPHASGEQQGMVLDFGFLKEEMLAVIDAPCDHGFLAQIGDGALLAMFAPDGRDAAAWQAELAARVAAEELAAHWFSRLAPRVAARSDGLAALVNLRVWETPNCHADYSA